MDQTRADEVLKKNAQKVSQIAKKLGLLLAKKKVEAKETGDLIAEHIYLGSYSAACNKQWLKEAKVKKVLMCLEHLRPTYPSDFQYLQLPMKDTESQNIAKHFDDAYSFIDKAVSNGQNVLVHCFAGVSRAPSILASYFIKKDRAEAESVLNMIKNKRTKINPNSGFLRQLKILSQEVRSGIEENALENKGAPIDYDLGQKEQQEVPQESSVNEPKADNNSVSKEPSEDNAAKLEQLEPNRSPQQLQLIKKPLSQDTKNIMTNVISSILEESVPAIASQEYKTKQSGIYTKKTTSIEYVVEKDESLVPETRADQHNGQDKAAVEPKENEQKQIEEPQQIEIEKAPKQAEEQAKIDQASNFEQKIIEPVVQQSQQNASTNQVAQNQQKQAPDNQQSAVEPTKQLPTNETTKLDQPANSQMQKPTGMQEEDKLAESKQVVQEGTTESKKDSQGQHPLQKQVAQGAQKAEEPQQAADPEAEQKMATTSDSKTAGEETVVSNELKTPTTQSMAEQPQKPIQGDQPEKAEASKKQSDVKEEEKEEKEDVGAKQQKKRKKDKKRR